ncbi:MAG: cupin domain-containing protein [Candidatus Zixiibacteriota bacterium]
MRIMHQTNVDAKKVEMEGAKNVTIQWLISQDHGAPNFAMRRFVISKDGHTPYHNHRWEHEVYIIEGKGTLTLEGEKHQLVEGSFAFVPPNAKHNFSTETRMVFLCMIPNPE